MLKAEWSRYIENSTDVKFLANVSTNNKTIASVSWNMTYDGKVDCECLCN